MRINLEFNMKDHLEVGRYKTYSADEVIAALRQQLEAAQVIWPELRQVKLVDEKKQDALGWQDEVNTIMYPFWEQSNGRR